MDKNFDRLLQLLQLIPSKTRGKLSTSELRDRLHARGFDVAPRTVQRDLEALAAKYGFDRDDRNKPYGWSWAVEKERFSVIGMSVNQAISLRLLKTFLTDLLPETVLRELRPMFDEADNLLKTNYGHAAVSRWSDKVAIVPATQTLIAPKISPAVHEIVSNALFTDKQLEITYTSPGSDVRKTHQVHPLGLVQQGAFQYLAMVFEGYTQARMIPMHRIKKAKALDQDVALPDGLSLHSAIEQGLFGFWSESADLHQIKLVARFSCGAADHLQEAPLSKDQEIQVIDADFVRLTATLPFTERLIWWLLGFGPNVVVEEPTDLKEEMISRLKHAMAGYK